jgi:hypothetical protein
VSTQETPDRLEATVSTAADIARLSEHDRATLAGWLARAAQPRAMPAPARRRRRITLLAATSAAVFLVPWIAILSATLPNNYTAHQWRIVWIGFDVALITAFVTIAWTGLLTRQIVIPALIITATLLLCDAWFDITMSWGSNEQTASLITAALGELPLAMFLLAVAFRILMALAHHVWRLEGRRDPFPHLRKVPILITTTPGTGRSRPTTNPPQQRK